ncbi:protein of unknown function [Bradyrhizobium sp. ORS 285]|uniref:hypothetical protein n=1 Tax=Bradyrhizobium sp. ORS 285 TaxID=115808 RepID=UPI0002406D98|nr:hypothetical protein [Bradyrhizobium sp. ORS 285]CCD87865.1 hypothetical protein BRAO285_2630006 [Bradyrhizobium sp. ORS 285]SMX62161.1 protein of unknown function [Bradyrhizobium sp. ORS 285]
MIPYTYEQMQAVVDEIAKQSDRGAALVAASAVDNFLECLIIARLPQLEPKRQKALFSQPNSPLSSFSSKIEIGFALGLFDEERRVALHLIRDVRNRFAHKMDPIRFEDPDICAMLEQRLPTGIKAYRTMSSREKFLLMVNTLIPVLGFAAYYPQIKINRLDCEPSFRSYVQATVDVLMRHVTSKTTGE